MPGYQTGRTLPRCCHDEGRFLRTPEDPSRCSKRRKVVHRKGLVPEVPRHHHVGNRVN
jgi:hypothetical protein